MSSNGSFTISSSQLSFERIISYVFVWWLSSAIPWWWGGESTNQRIDAKQFIVGEEGGNKIGNNNMTSNT